MTATDSSFSTGVQVSQTIELQGHLFDSLTLSKVIDTIQQQGGEFRINNLRMGSRKHDLSYASIKIFTGGAEALEALLEALVPYGVRVAGSDDAVLATCPADGVLPENALKMYVPKSVKVAGEWVPVSSVDGDWVMTIGHEADRAKVLLKKAKTVTAGEQVVLGFQGVIW